MMSRLVALLTAINGDLCLLWTLTLLHFLWQGCVVYAIVIAGHWLLRNRKARTRYLVDLAGLIALPVCVAATWMMIAPQHDATTGQTVSLAPGVDQMLTAPISRAAPPIVQENAVVTESPVTVPDSQAEDTGATMSWDTLIAVAAPAVAGSWLVGVFIFLTRLMLAIRGSQRLRRTSRAITDARLLALIRRASESMKLRCVPVVAYCDEVVVPVVSGIVKPMVLLPAGLATGLDNDQLLAVISHELSHIRRLDLLVNMLQRLVESTLFFHPVVWLISRRMSDTRESCCDEMVVDAGCEPMVYAGALLRMAELCRSQVAMPSTTVAAAGQGTTQLERRIVRLMDGHQPDRLQMTRAGFLTSVIAVVTLAITAGVTNSWIRAEDVPPPTLASGDEQQTQGTLTELVAAVNQEIEALPYRVDVQPLNATTLLDFVHHAGSSTTGITTEQMQILQGLEEHEPLPRGVSLRHFVRYDTGMEMKHGSWLRLYVNADGADPFGIDLRSAVVFARPYTQAERLDRRQARQSGKFPLFERLVTVFREDPRLGQAPPLRADYDQLVQEVHECFRLSDSDRLMALYHRAGLRDDQNISTSTIGRLREEAEQLVRRKVRSVHFERRRFSGELYQWQAAQKYAANAPVEGDIVVRFDDADSVDPSLIALEAGSVQGEPRLVCHVVTQDDSSRTARLSWEAVQSTDRVRVPVADTTGVYEESSTLTAPDELAPLREFNRELTRFDTKAAGSQAADVTAFATPAPFDLRFVDACTESDIADSRFRFQMRFREPAPDGRRSSVVDTVMWGPNASSRISFVIRDRVRKHPDYEQLVVDWNVTHPNYHATSGQFILGDWLRGSSEATQSALRATRLQPVGRHIMERLSGDVSFRARGESMAVVLGRLQREFGVPVTVVSEELPDDRRDLRTPVNVAVADTPLRDAFSRVLSRADLTFEATESGIRVPARVTGVVVDYDIVGAEPTGRLALYQVDGRTDVADIDMRYIRWGALRNGSSTRIVNLLPGIYRVGRMRSVVALDGLSSARMQIGLYLDGTRCEVRAGELTPIDLKRPDGRRLVGRVVGPANQNYSRPVYYVCSPETLGTDPVPDADSVLYDANNTDEDGQFSTESLTPGDYVLVAHAWKRDADTERDEQGRTGPDFAGRTLISVPARGELPLCEIELLAH